jgi:hypothetical protein
MAIRRPCPICGNGDGALAITLETTLRTAAMREAGLPPIA